MGASFLPSFLILSSLEKQSQFLLQPTEVSWSGVWQLVVEPMFLSMIFRSHRWPLYIKNCAAIFVGQGTLKYCNLKIFKSQCLIEYMRYGPNFLHVSITCLGFKIIFRNMAYAFKDFWRVAKMPLPPLFSSESETLPLTERVKKY